jgi:pyruvate kinase
VTDAHARPRHTKLVCTLGPATVGREAELVDAGMDVARLNFSHGTAAERAAAAAAVVRASSAAGRPVAVLADLAGPKIRTGELRGGSVDLVPGAMFILEAGGSGRPGDVERVGVTDPRLAAEVRAGDQIVLGDGVVELRVERTAGDDVVAAVVRGGTIRSRTGVSIPSDRRSGGPLTPKDRSDVRSLAALGVHYVAQSFVRRAEDVEALRQLLGDPGPPIVVKVETRPAIERFDEILDLVDGVMIARGDLGVELPYEEVPLVQKQLLRRALDRGVPTIVATQMLESMVEAARPTRAEASDVANAVFDGADAIMLSGETAIGTYPILAAEAAVRIAAHCEAEGREYLPDGAPPPVESDAGSLAYAAVALAAAEDDVAAIACFTRSGRTARLLSSLRPVVPIHAFSSDPTVVSRLALVHGVVPHLAAAPSSSTDTLGSLAALVASASFIPRGTAVVLVASTSTEGSAPNRLELLRPGS